MSVWRPAMPGTYGTTVRPGRDGVRGAGFVHVRGAATAWPANTVAGDGDRRECGAGRSHGRGNLCFSNSWARSGPPASGQDGLLAGKRETEHLGRPLCVLDPHSTEGLAARHFLVGRTLRLRGTDGSGHTEQAALGSQHAQNRARSPRRDRRSRSRPSRRTAAAPRPERRPTGRVSGVSRCGSCPRTPSSPAAGSGRSCPCAGRLAVRCRPGWCRCGPPPASWPTPWRRGRH